jgi:hypothetical protein
VTRGRLQADDNSLERRCLRWINGIREHFAGTPVVPLQAQPEARESFKMA